MAQTLKVVANPWAAVDENARPCGRVVREQADNDVRGIKYIGAELVADEVQMRKTRRVGNAIETTQEARYDRRWKFSLAPVEVPAPKGKLTGYYSDRVRRNELLAANEATAAAAGLPKFIEPGVIIAESKALRRAEFDAQHGAGAFDALQPEEETPAVEAIKPPVVAKQVTAEPKRAATTKS